MYNKKLIIILIVFFVLVLGTFWVWTAYNSNKVNRLLTNKTNEFVPIWGTYDYKDFAKYPERTKPYLSEEAYNTYFGNKDSLYIRGGRFITQEYSIKTTVNKSKFVKKINSEYRIDSSITESVHSVIENDKNNKTTSIFWKKINNEWKITKINYQ